MSVNPSAAREAVLSVRNLRVQFPSQKGLVNAASGVSFDVFPNEVVGIVGESGAGKTVTALAALGLLPRSVRVSGQVMFRGRNVVGLDGDGARSIRGSEIAMVFQDASAALDPLRRVGRQIAEAITTHHRDVSRNAVRARVIELLAQVGIPNPETRARQYPHELSGGMRQRATIAMAIANGPAVLIADEPTTALDVTTQAQVLELLRRVRELTQASMVLITHDLGVVAGVADRVVVMYAGRVVESGTVERIFADPRHPYTQGLLASLPRVDDEVGRLTRIAGQAPSLVELPSGCPFHPRCPYGRLPDPCASELPDLRPVSSDHLSACHFAGELGQPRPVEGRNVKRGTTPSTGADPILEVRDLKKHFPVRTGLLGRARGHVHAVCDVSLEIRPGETLGLVGESGSGKSTTALLALGLLDPTSGSVQFRGTDLHSTTRSELRVLRRSMQLVFQDPFATLDPRMTVGASIAEPLKIHRLYREGGHERVRDVMNLVELNPDDADRYPHEFSGGQRQRVGIARALALGPQLLILDEPVSSLDTSIQAGIINLLADLQNELGVAYLFIAHNLSVIRHISHTVAVMYLGRIVETGSRRDLFGHPAHPYTQALLSAVPIPNPELERRRHRIVLAGDPPSAVNPPSGCRFRTRCWKAEDLCAEEEPALVDRGQGHPVACHFPTAPSEHQGFTG